MVRIKPSGLEAYANHREVSRPMSALNLAGFLSIDKADVEQVQGFAEALSADSQKLSSDFHDYLKSHPESDRLLNGATMDGRQDLPDLLVDNFHRMLTLNSNVADRENPVQLRSLHYRAGVMTSWIVSAYRIYLDYLQDQLSKLALSADHHRRLDKALIKYVFYDLSLQLKGYEQERLDDVHESDAVAHAVLEATLSLDNASAIEDVLTSICDRLVSATPHIRAAWFCLGGVDENELKPEYYAGDPSVVPLLLGLTQDDPLVTVFSEQRPVVFNQGSAPVPQWCFSNQDIQAVGVFPFALNEPAFQGCFVIHADSARYFDNLGLTIFQALATLAQLLIELREQIQLDPLTRLPNRTAFTTRITASLERVKREGSLLCVGVLDLDDFKPINDSYGHAAGDELLCILAERLRHGLREGDMVARLSGDEFALVLESFDSVNELEQVIRRLEASLSQPFQLPGDREVRLKASLGLTIYPFDEAPPDGLIRHADQAMYESKNLKGQRESSWNYWSPMRSLEKTTAAWPDTAGPVAYFQPVVDLLGQGVVSVEVLARLKLPDGRILSPASFLGSLGMKARRDLTQEMLRQGLELISSLDSRGIHLALSFNVDADFIIDTECATCFKEVVEASGIDPTRITLEILEKGEFLTTSTALDLLNRLRETGAKIALDDVGSAYSSLLRLKELPIDRIKLDQAFMSDLEQHPENLLFVMSMQSLAQGIGVELVVEGVETEQILDAMVAIGIDAAQGYAIASPKPADEFIDWLEDSQPKSRQPGDDPTTLLGAYAAHLQQRALIDSIVRQGILVGSLNLPQSCPLVRFLTSQKHALSKQHDSGPMLEAHHEIMEIFRGQEKLSNCHPVNEDLKHAERQLAHLVAKALGSVPMASA